MRRRCLLLLPFASGFAVARADDDAGGSRHKISAAALHAAMAERFPLRAGVRGLLELELDSPRLLLLPARNQLGAGLQVQVRGMQLQPPPAPGDIEIAFGLRYEPADRSVRAVRPRVLDVSWPGLAPQDRQALQGLLSGLVRQVDEVVLQRLSPRDLALPEAMGLQPGELQVVADGVIVHFAPAR